MNIKRTIQCLLAATVLCGTVLFTACTEASANNQDAFSHLGPFAKVNDFICAHNRSVMVPDRQIFALICNFAPEFKQTDGYRGCNIQTVGAAAGSRSD